MQKTLEISTASRVIKKYLEGSKTKGKSELEKLLLLVFIRPDNRFAKAMQKTLEISTA
jgi:hypothetical protein